MIIDFISNISIGGIISAIILFTAISLLFNSTDAGPKLNNAIREKFNFWDNYEEDQKYKEFQQSLPKNRFSDSEEL